MNWRQLEQRTTNDEELQLVQSVSGLSINLSLSLVGCKYNQTFCCRSKELEAFNNWTNCSELNAKQKSAKVNICTTGQLGWWRQSADSVELAWAQLSWAQLVPCSLHSLLRSRRPCLSRCSPRRGSIASPSRTLREHRDTRDLIPTARLGSVANESNVVGAKDK